jgi:ribosomal protein L16 Arg81 hydroxylase
MGPTDLSDVLQPYSPQEFLASTWGKTYRYIPGQPGKFTDLLPWSRLNSILGEHRFEPQRLRLVMETSVIPPHTYQHSCQGGAGEQVPRLDPVKLNKLLRDGTMLVLNAADEMIEPIGRLAASLEKSLHASVQAGAYANWGTSPGFGSRPHQDSYDVLVMQVAGRKRWTIYREAHGCAAAGEKNPGAAVAGEPVWDQGLEDGDFLYLPRGCWHTAAPLAEPTLHLTIVCRNPTGLDFLGWLQEELRSHPDFSSDLPRFGTAAEQTEHLERLRGELLGALDARALERFFQIKDGTAAPRNRFSLPWSAMPDALPPDDNASIRWTVPRRVALREGPEAETVELWANGEKWQFARAAEAVLCPLMDGGTHTVDEICERARETLDRERVRSFLGELVVQGLVAVVDPPQ